MFRLPWSHNIRLKCPWCEEYTEHGIVDRPEELDQDFGLSSIDGEPAMWLWGVCIKCDRHWQATIRVGKFLKYADKLVVTCYDGSLGPEYPVEGYDDE